MSSPPTTACCTDYTPFVEHGHIVFCMSCGNVPTKTGALTAKIVAQTPSCFLCGKALPGAKPGHIGSCSACDQADISAEFTQFIRRAGPPSMPRQIIDLTQDDENGRDLLARSAPPPNLQARTGNNSVMTSTLPPSQHMGAFTQAAPLAQHQPYAKDPTFRTTYGPSASNWMPSIDSTPETSLLKRKRPTLPDYGLGVTQPKKIKTSVESLQCPTDKRRMPINHTKNNGVYCTQCCNKMKGSLSCMWEAARIEVDEKGLQVSADNYGKIVGRMIVCQAKKGQTGWCECTPKQFQTMPTATALRGLGAQPIIPHTATNTMAFSPAAELPKKQSGMRTGDLQSAYSLTNSHASPVTPGAGDNPGLSSSPPTSPTFTPSAETPHTPGTGFDLPGKDATQQAYSLDRAALLPEMHKRKRSPLEDVDVQALNETTPKRIRTSSRQQLPSQRLDALPRSAKQQANQLSTHANTPPDDDLETRLRSALRDYTTAVDDSITAMPASTVSADGYVLGADGTGGAPPGYAPVISRAL